MEKYYNQIKKAIYLQIIFGFYLFLKSYAIFKLYSWYITTLGFPKLLYYQILGIILLVKLIQSTFIKANNEKFNFKDSAIKLLGSLWFHYFLLLIGYVMIRLKS